MIIVHTNPERIFAFEEKWELSFKHKSVKTQKSWKGQDIQSGKFIKIIKKNSGQKENKPCHKYLSMAQKIPNQKGFAPLSSSVID